MARIELKGIRLPGVELPGVELPGLWTGGGRAGGRKAAKVAAPPQELQGSLVDAWVMSGDSLYNRWQFEPRGVKGRVMNLYNFSFERESGYGLWDVAYTPKSPWLEYYSYVLNDHGINSVILKEEEGWDNFCYTQLANWDGHKMRFSTDWDCELVYQYIFLTGEKTEETVPVCAYVPMTVDTMPKAASADFPWYSTFVFWRRTDGGKRLRVDLLPVEHDGCLVFDGVTDYAVVKDTGFKAGTVIMGVTDIVRGWPSAWQYFFDTDAERAYFGKKGDGNYLSNGDFSYDGATLVARFSPAKAIGSPLYLGTGRLLAGGNEKMAVRYLAIYSDVLTDGDAEAEKMKLEELWRSGLWKAGV